MKHKIYYLLLAFVLALAGTGTLSAQSEVYGVINSGEEAGLYKYTIGSSGVSNVELIQPFTFDTELNSSQAVSGGYLLGTSGPEGDVVTEHYWMENIAR